MCQARWATSLGGIVNQRRGKWATLCGNMIKEWMVIVAEDNVRPLKWLIRRITEVEVGNDGKVKVASFKTPTGELKRPILQLSP